jgi:biotin transport system substrate-specific component
LEVPVTTTARPLLVHALFPIAAPLPRTALRLLLGVAFLALLAQVRIAIGPVPITGQTLGVLLLAAAYGPRLGVATVAGYLALGAVGLPIFAGAAGGAAVFAGATAGYLIGFLPAAWLVGALAERFGTLRPARVIAAMIAGNAVVYAFGLLHLRSFAPDWATAFAWGLAPFLLGDAVKIALATLLLGGVSRWLARR